MSVKQQKKNVNTILAAVFVIVFICAISIYAYTILVQKGETDTETPSPIPAEVLLTVHVNSEVYNYTLDDLLAFDNVTEQGSYVNRIGRVSGPYMYTGVPMTVFLDTIPSLPTNYTVHAVASDGYTLNYTPDEVNGYIMTYNETGAEIGLGNFTMLIAYQEDGVFLNETTRGPLRIVFVDSEPSITFSGLWLSSLFSLEIL